LLQEKIYAAFGVPPGIATTTGQRFATSSEAEKTFDAHIQRIRSQVEMCMTDSLCLCDKTDASAEDAWESGIYPNGTRRGRGEMRLISTPR
jgi:hypothetical protein